MKEQSSGGIKRMGQERWKYLDMANMSFAAGDPIACEKYLDAFLETIDENSDAAKKITIEYNRIESERLKKHNDLDSQTKELGYLELQDYQNRGKQQIEVDAILEKKTVCWTVAMNGGLFSE